MEDVFLFGEGEGAGGSFCAGAGLHFDILPYLFDKRKNRVYVSALLEGRTR